MGNFYTNITLHGPSQPEILSFLRSEIVTAFVSPTSDLGATVIYEQESDEQNLDALDAITSRLSSRFDCPALAVLVHDDNILLLRLHQSGTLVFTYDSQQTWHAGIPRLCRAFSASSAVFPIWLTLHRPHFTFLFEHFRHRSVIRGLRLPECAVASGYTYIHRGETPPGLSRDQLRHTRRD